MKKAVERPRNGSEKLMKNAVERPRNGSGKRSGKAKEWRWKVQ